MLTVLLYLLGFGVVSFLQNAAFTWPSRSRASGDPNYHRYASWCSNGIYYVTNALLTLYIVKTGGLAALALQGLIYTVVTAEGSVLMMKILLKKETGKRKVGAGQDVELFTKAEGAVIRELIFLHKEELSESLGIVFRKESTAEQGNAQGYMEKKG